jgi:hypothetical protein
MTVGSNCFILTPPDDTEILCNVSSSALGVPTALSSQTGRVAKNNENDIKENYGGKGCDAIVTTHDPASRGKIRHVTQQSLDSRVAVLIVAWWKVAVVL